MHLRNGSVRTGKMIYCANNSAAHKYAKKNHLPYTIVDPVKTSYKATDLSLSTKRISMPIGAKKRVLYQVTPFMLPNVM